MLTTLYFTVLLAIFLSSHETSARNYVNAPVVNHILGRSNPLLIPMTRPDESLRVTMAANVLSINKVEREKNQVGVTFMVTQFWPSGITWNPENFNNISRQVLPISLVWTPDIVIRNAASSPDMFSPGNVIFMNHGLAVLVLHFNIVLACDLSAEDKCMAKFQSNDFTNDFLVLDGPQNFPFNIELFHEVWLNSGGRFQARDGKYMKSELKLFQDDNSSGIDVVTYAFSIKDTRPHYRRGPSKLMLSWY